MMKIFLASLVLLAALSFAVHANNSTYGGGNYSAGNYSNSSGTDTQAPAISLSISNKDFFYAFSTDISCTANDTVGVKNIALSVEGAVKCTYFNASGAPSANCLVTYHPSEENIFLFNETYTVVCTANDTSGNIAQKADSFIARRPVGGGSSGGGGGSIAGNATKNASTNATRNITVPVNAPPNKTEPPRPPPQNATPPQEPGSSWFGNINIEWPQLNTSGAGIFVATALPELLAGISASLNELPKYLDQIPVINQMPELFKKDGYRLFLLGVFMAVLAVFYVAVRHFMHKKRRRERRLLPETKDVEI